MKWTILLIYSVVIPTLSYAQRHEIQLGADYPLSKGIGISAKYLRPVNNTISLSFQAEAIRYHNTFTALPVKLGFNFRHKSFYAEPQLGLTYFGGNSTPYQNGATTYGANLGAYLNDHITLSGNYERWNKGGFGADHFGIQLAYGFHWSKKPNDTNAAHQRLTYQPPAGYRQSDAWKKHKTFKAIGWTSIGVGVTLTLAGIVTAVASRESTHINRHTGDWLAGSGLFIFTGSIPCFILANKFKRRARHPIN